MSLIERVLGSPVPAMGMDDAMVRRVERALRRVEPDPLFRRRLRGQIVNHYVADREGLLAQPRPKGQMGRLGRSVLYASLATAVSVSAVGAAAQDSLPGDALYGVKLQLEDVRMRIAPRSVRAELAAIALAERVEEMERLADSGAWHLVPQAAARVAEARQELIAIDPVARGRAAIGQLGARNAIETVLAAAPPAARGGLQRALQVIAPPASGGSQRTGKPPDAPAGPPTAEPDPPAAGADVDPKATRAPDPRVQEGGRPSSSPRPSPRPQPKDGPPDHGSRASG